MFLKGRIVYPYPHSDSAEGAMQGDDMADEDMTDDQEECFPSNTNNSSRGGGKTTPCAMTAVEEHLLATYISLLSRSGKALKQHDISIMAQQIVESKDKKAFRKSNCPTLGWVQKFKSRHPELEYKTSEHVLMKTNSEPTRSDLQCWQNDLQTFFKLDWKLEVESVFTPQNAHRIYTCDEIIIAFSKLDDKGEKIPLKSLLKTSQGEDKQLVTVIAAASAAGHYLRPQLLTSEKHINTSQFPTLDPASYMSVYSPTGLITHEIFLNWIKYFDSYLSMNNITRPVVILLDDHQAHFHITVFLYCLDKMIIPVCLPPKLNKIIQPLLTHFFPKLMMAYQACCKRYSSKTSNAVTPHSFPYIMMKAWTLVAKSKYVTDGFTACKLIPMEVTQLPVLQDDPSPSNNNNNNKQSSTPSSLSKLIKDEPTSNGSDDECEVSTPQQENCSISIATSKPKKMIKKRKLNNAQAAPTLSCNSTSSSASSSVILGDKFVSEDRKSGRREGIEMCLSVLESFVPADILPVWRQRASSHTGTCEIGYCMWKAVQLLHKGGLDVTGQIQPQQLNFGQQD